MLPSISSWEDDAWSLFFSLEPHITGYPESEPKRVFDWLDELTGGDTTRIYSDHWPLEPFIGEHDR